MRWNFKAEYVKKNKAIVTATAYLEPGWHIYSQFLKEGGPQPTHLSFNNNEGYSPVGRPKENGKPLKFYDDNYEMKITWFSGEVSFQQEIKFTKPPSVIQGTVDYMTCNDQMCIPDTQDFKIDH
ncbi:MAG: protein-disulfide reductase DsbD domain-containing protein [Bacteroidota bacterium]